MSKLLSGRFIFTVLTAIVFAQMSMSGRIPPSEAMAVIMLVIGFYFNRTDRNQQQNGGQK